ncbi:MAG: hypothetical protein K1X75_08020 [Leptospirales bacterium]|nr:hypothetical protein [Leptospirales bacterium]
MPSVRRILLLPPLAMLAMLAPSPVFSVDAMEDNIAFREARDRARETGFGDLEIDILHGKIAAQAGAALALDSIPEQVTNFNELIDRAQAQFFVRGKDSQGKPYLRITLREGYSFSTEEHPIQYIFRAHCYLFPAADGKSLDRIVFQFYRVNFSGSNYTRELRRIVHPNPKDVAQAEGKPLGAQLALLDNSQLTLEQYEEPSNVRPAWENRDGVPLPDLGIEPKHRVILNDRNDPVDYGRQVRILNRYKRLLRRIDYELEQRMRFERLERGRILERILDFPT